MPISKKPRKKKSLLRISWLNKLFNANNLNEESKPIYHTIGRMKPLSRKIV